MIAKDSVPEKAKNWRRSSISDQLGIGFKENGKLMESVLLYVLNTS